MMRAEANHGVVAVRVSKLDVMELSALDALQLASDLRYAAQAVIDQAVEDSRTRVVTKADLLPTADQMALARTPFGRDGDGACTGCGDPLPTELAFAAHFGITATNLRARTWNLGYCPKAGH